MIPFPLQSNVAINSCSIGVDDNASLSVSESLVVILIYVMESCCVPRAQNDRGFLRVRLKPGKRSNLFVFPVASSLMGVPSSVSGSDASPSRSSQIGTTNFAGPPSLEQSEYEECFSEEASKYSDSL
jgi:hypothetical protein